MAAWPFLVVLLRLVSSLLISEEPDRRRRVRAKPGTNGGKFVGPRRSGPVRCWAANSLLASVNRIGSGLTLIAVVIVRDEAMSPAIGGMVLGGMVLGGLVLGSAVLGGLSNDSMLLLTVVPTTARRTLLLSGK